MASSMLRLIIYLTLRGWKGIPAIGRVTQMLLRILRILRITFLGAEAQMEIRL
jgi:hypothetical protein